MTLAPFQKRLECLQNDVNSKEILLVEDPTCLLYLTGFDLSAGKLAVTHQSSQLFVDSRYFGRCRQQAVCPVELLTHDSFASYLQKTASQQIDTLAFDTTTTTYQRYQELEQLIKKNSSLLKLKPISNPLQKLRAIKDLKEIELMKAAGKLCVEGMHYVLTLLKEGVTELEVAKQLEIFWLHKGGEGLSFSPIIAFGANSAFPHYRAQEVALKKGEIVLIDIGVKLHGYHSDMTRTVFFGEPHPKLMEIYTLVDQAQEEAMKACRPGITVASLDLASRQFLQAKGYGDHFLHGLGHGVGLQIHEYPPVNSRPSETPSPVLKEGMVITIEPGLYLEGLGGVRLEDTVVLTESGHYSITPFPKEPFLNKYLQ